MKNNVILIGFMGSGKTTFGKWLSKHDNMQFLDTDEYIEKQQNRKISNIFATDGEDAFRDMETATLQELITKTDNTVISVGGGLPVREENRKLLKELGTVIYLEAPENELVRRLSGDTTRPLLKGTDLKTKIHQLMQARQSLYLDAADIRLMTDKHTFAQMYDILKNELDHSML